MKSDESNGKVGDEIVKLRFYTDFNFNNKIPDQEFEDEVYKLVSNTRLEITEQAENLVKRNLGDEFFITDMEINRGSIEIILIIGGVIGSAYVGISKYKNFVESVELLQKQLRSIFAHHMRMPAYSIDINWLRGKDMEFIVSSAPPKMISEAGGLVKPLVSYLVISNLILLLVLIVMVFKE